jgi:hypothetical protein
MSGRRGRLLVCTLVIGLAGTGRSVVAAAPDQEGVDHVRTSSAVIARLIEQAAERSQTFKGLVDPVNASDGIVYIEKGDCTHGVRSCFVNVTMAGRHRMLWVKVDLRGVDCDVMGLLGHELRHTLEVLSDPQVTDFSAMYFFYSRELAPGSTFPFETAVAKRTGEAVRAEVRHQSSCSKIR